MSVATSPLHSLLMEEITSHGGKFRFLIPSLSEPPVGLSDHKADSMASNVLVSLCDTILSCLVIRGDRFSGAKLKSWTPKGGRGFSPRAAFCAVSETNMGIIGSHFSPTLFL